MQIFDILTPLNINGQEIKIHKIFQIDKLMQKYYLISNIGIFIAYYLNENSYQIDTLFMETTPGRIIFSNNFKNAIK